MSQQPDIVVPDDDDSEVWSFQPLHCLKAAAEETAKKAEEAALLSGEGGDSIEAAPSMPSRNCATPGAAAIVSIPGPTLDWYSRCSDASPFADAPSSTERGCCAGSGFLAFLDRNELMPPLSGPVQPQWEALHGGKPN